MMLVLKMDKPKVLSPARFTASMHIEKRPVLVLSQGAGKSVLVFTRAKCALGSDSPDAVVALVLTHATGTPVMVSSPVSESPGAAPTGKTLLVFTPHRCAQGSDSPDAAAEQVLTQAAGTPVLVFTPDACGPGSDSPGEDVATAESPVAVVI
ncbi:uncharacterized protein LOC133885492 isoform X2 [Phragmites australis]|uniref:uncharacterized protein LOC133885492 isoform X2 n=1 Tax=Phragmites australis TaxID=29695 RepID=UPI002D768795|nr:uncharacterized protein LOC133885492 isoform X2 [Phragmites australis]